MVTFELAGGFVPSCDGYAAPALCRESPSWISGSRSLCCPLARGTGPLLSFLGALLIVGEHASVISGTGALFVTFGILLLSGSTWNHERRWAGAFWGVATGVTIVGHTLVDGYSISVLLLSPILVEYAGNLFCVMVWSCRAWQERGSLVKGYRECWKEALGVALLTPIAYVRVVFAMRIAPIGRVAPAREMSMIIGAYLGTRLLGEGHVARRLIASLLASIERDLFLGRERQNDPASGRQRREFALEHRSEVTIFFASAGCEASFNGRRSEFFGGPQEIDNTSREDVYTHP